MKKTIFFFYFIITSLISISVNAFSNAPDSTAPGPHEVASAEYRLPAAIDPDVLPDQMTEIWAKMFYPKDIPSSGKMPLILMLHGNHGTCGTGNSPRYDYSCEYTDSGMCPEGYVVTPNHEGYNYLAENLASWGYIVVSVNANRGITCGGGNNGDWGLNLARGKLILKHLSYLYQWSTTGGAPVSLGLGQQGLIGKIDFSAVGLFGHSRGGEGVRAAYNLYLDPGSAWPAKIPGLSVKAIFEVGAVDGQTSRVLDANGTAWNQLLPMCDGDVSDLEGRRPFERMLLNPKEPKDSQKSLYEVWGANHNFFNTEWQNSDSSACAIGKTIFNTQGYGSEEQKKIALASVPAFFKSHLGVNPNIVLNQNFNPLDNLPSVVTEITQIDRDFTPSPALDETLVVEDFDKETGINSSGNSNQASQITIEHQFLDNPQRAADIHWQAAGLQTFFEALWSAPSQGKDVHDFATLDFRVGRQPSERMNSPTDFSIQLEDAAGHFSKLIAVSDYAVINGPGTASAPILKTIRIPLTVFNGVDLTKIRGVRCVFDKTPTGALYLANIRFNRQRGLGDDNLISRHALSMKRVLNTNKINTILPEYVPAELNSIRVVHHVLKKQLAKAQSVVEIVVSSKVPFPVMDRLPVLQIGSKKYLLSRYSDMSHLKEMTFTLTEEQYKNLPKRSEAILINGKIWKFGVLKN